MPLTRIVTLASLLSIPAYAHVGPPAGVEVWHDNGTFVGGHTTFGVVELVDGTPLWTAEETLTVGLPAFVHRRALGDFIAGTVHGLYRTDNGGCSWVAVPGALEDRQVVAMEADPSSPTHLYAVTATYDGDNGLFVSTDNGDTWTATGLLRSGFFAAEVIVAPGAQDLWVHGYEVATEQHVMVHSGDGGTQWDTTGADWSAYDFVRLIRRLDDGRFIASARVADGDRAGEQDLLVSDDGMASFDIMQSFAAPTDGGLDRILDYWEWGSRRWAVVFPPAVWGVEGSGDLAPLPEGPDWCIDPSVDSNVLWGCDLVFDGSPYVYTEDGDTWQPAFAPWDIEPRQCPAGTDGETLNPFYWNALGPPLQPNPDGGPTDGGDSDPDGGDWGPGDGDGDGDGDDGDAVVKRPKKKGCVSAPGLPWALAGLLLMARRRRR